MLLNVIQMYRFIYLQTSRNASSGGGDDTVVTVGQLKQIYDAIPADKVTMRRKDTAHGQVLYPPDGYVMAWFMWQLKSDTHATATLIGAIRKLKQTRSTRINILIFTEFERPRRNALLPGLSYFSSVLYFRGFNPGFKRSTAAY